MATPGAAADDADLKGGKSNGWGQGGGCSCVAGVAAGGWMVVVELEEVSYEGAGDVIVTDGG